MFVRPLARLGLWTLVGAFLPVCLLADTYVPVIIKDFPTGGSASGYVNDTFAFNVEATDSGGNLSKAEWYVDSVLKKTSTLGAYYSAVPTFNWLFSASGTHNISITVKDSSGNAAYAGWSVAVANRTPSASRSSPSSSSVTVNVGSSQQFTVAGSDADGNLAFVEWYRDGSYLGRTDVSGASITTSHTENFGATGSHTVTAIVYDAEVANSSATWNVTAVCPQIGSFNLVAPSSGATLGSTTTSVLLQWNPASSATAYDVYFGTGSAPGVVASGLSTTSTSVSVSAGQTYSWRVRATNACGAQAFSSGGYQSFWVAAPNGALSFTVRSLDGSLKSGATCKLYDNNYQYLTGQDRSSISGMCSWNALSVGSYHVEAWNPSQLQPFPGDEFWGATPVAISNGATTTATFQRVEPHVGTRPEFRLNDANGRVLLSTDHVYAGQTVFVKATVQQQAGFTQSSTVQMALDYARDASYDVDTAESSAQIVTSGGSGTPFSFSFTVPSLASGSQTLAYGLRVRTFTSNSAKTDGWAWGDAFVVDAPSSVTVEPQAVRAGNTCPLLVRIKNLTIPIDGSTTIRALKNGTIDPAITITVDTSKPSALYARVMCPASVDRSVPRALQVTSGGATVTVNNALTVLAPRTAPAYFGPYVWETDCTRIYTFLSDSVAARAEVQALKTQGFRTVLLQTDCGILNTTYEAGLTAFLEEAQSGSPVLDVHAYAANGNHGFRALANTEAQDVMNWNASHIAFRGIHLNFEPTGSSAEDAMFEALDTTADIVMRYGSQTIVSLTAGSKGPNGMSGLDWRLDSNYAVDYCDATQFADVFIAQAYLIDASASSPTGTPVDLASLIDQRLQFLTPISSDKTVDESALSFLGLSDYDRVTAFNSKGTARWSYYVSSDVRFCGEPDWTLAHLRAVLPNSETATTYPQGIESHIFTIPTNRTFDFVGDDGKTTITLAAGEKLVVLKTISTAPAVQHIPNGRYAIWHVARRTGETPSAAYGLAVSWNANGSDLSWNYRCTCMTGFIVERKIGTGAWTPIADMPVDLSTFSSVALSASYHDRQPTSCSDVSYRVKSYNAIKGVYSVSVSATCAGKPSASTGATSSVTEAEATFNATVNPNNAQTTTSFDYGLTAAYGQNVPAQTLSGNLDLTASASITGLQCGMPYHYRIVATNSAGTTTGSDAMFATNACASSSLVAHWPLDGNGSDISGRNNALTLSNVTPAPDRFGQTARAVALDAAAQSTLSLADGPSTDLTMAFTWAGWARFGRIDSASDGFASKTAGGSNATSMFYADTYAWDGSAPRYNQIRFWVLNGAAAYGFERAGPVLVKDRWYHIALVYDGAAGFVSVYVDGALTNTTPAPHSLNNCTAPFQMGVGSMTGALDDVSWYSRALSVAEIAQLAAPSAPANLIATATSETAVGLTWSAVPNATSYTVYRKGAGGTFMSRGATSTLSWSDGASAGAAYLYKVTASNAAGPSPDSNVDLATTVVFGDAALNAGTTLIKAVHMTELRSAINAVRALASLPNYGFTDSALTGMIVRGVHVTELRAALAEARAALGLSAVVYGEGTITSHSTLVKASHLTELRDGVR
jgi:hypothetical protein